MTSRGPQVPFRAGHASFAVLLFRKAPHLLCDTKAAATPVILSHSVLFAACRTIGGTCTVPAAMATSLETSEGRQQVKDGVLRALNKLNDKDTVATGAEEMKEIIKVRAL